MSSPASYVVKLQYGEAQSCTADWIRSLNSIVNCFRQLISAFFYTTSMEGWHSVDLDNISPLIALSLTTSRWGLEPLPGNLAVSNLTLKHLKSQGATSLSVWEFANGCSTSGDPEDVVYDDIPTNTTFCSKPKRCGQSDCINLIEGIGRTTTGPTGANIIGLAHGISILIVIISTIIMARWTFKFDKGEGRIPLPRIGIEHNHMKDHYTHPPEENNPPVSVPSTPKLESGQSPEPKTFVRAPPDEKKSKEISQCTDLLRQMYDMELQIKSSKDNVWSTERKGNRRRERADALRNEIQHIVNEWRSMPPGYFTTAERKLIDDICDAINSSYQRGRQTG